MFRPSILLLAVLAALVSAEENPAPAGGYKILKKIALGGDGFWDYLTIDSAAQKLYIGRSTRVMIVDMASEKLEAEIGGMTGVHGAAIVPDANRGFVTSGKDNTVRVFDLKTQKETDRLTAGKKPDAIIYDPFSKSVFAFNNGGTTVTIIDPATAKVTGEIELGGAPEFGVADGKGTVFVNLEDKSEIVVIDSKNMKVLNHWSLAPGEAPTGLSMDLEHRRLFSGCSGSKTMVVVDADSGKIVASLPIGVGVDATAFDKDSQNAFSSNRDGTLTVIHEDAPDAFHVIQNVQTQPGSKTMAFDPKSHTIWLAAAEMKDAPEGAAEQNRQRKIVAPGSFSVIVVGK